MTRASRQRVVVESVVADLDGFHSVQDIHAQLRSLGESVGLATVYRAVAALAREGALDALRTDRGETLYRQCRVGHHHHLICRRCGRALEVEGPAVERWAHRVATEHGFSDVSHILEITGTCADCARAAGRELIG